MDDVIPLVRGDTLPQLLVTLTDERKNNEPIDLSAAECQVRFHFRERGAKKVKETIPCFKIPGLDLPDGSEDLGPEWETPGKGGRVVVPWTPSALDTAGNFEGEFEIEFAPGKTQTVYQVFRFKIRPDYGTA